MNAPLAHTAWEPCLLEPIRDPATEAWLRREAGSAPPWVRYYLGCPWLAKAMLTLSIDHGVLGALDFPTADLMALVVSQENSCRYCYAVIRAQLRLLGMSEERMQALEQQLAQTQLEPRAAAAVRFARRLARADPLATPQDLALLQAAGFSETAAREAAFVVALTAFFNRLSTFAAMPPGVWEEIADRWYMRALQPIVALMLRRTRHRGAASVPLPTPPQAPFAELVRDFGGLPVAPALAATLDELWRSPLLPARSKVLMLAVIAHGLGETRAAALTARWAAEQGVNAAELARLLAEIGGPGPRTLEQQLLDFARDTLWYEPQSIQRRVRALREQLAPQAFVEALGIAAFGNSLCRLTAVLPAAA